MLKIRNLRKAYGGYHALNGLDMEIADGALYGFVGPNGAGKTTVFNLLTGVYKPNAGSIVLDGKNITGKSKIATSPISRSIVVSGFIFSTTFPTAMISTP
mgnify:CR=1 FL=1